MAAGELDDFDFSPLLPLSYITGDIMRLGSESNAMHLTTGVGVTSTPHPMSFRYVHDTQKDTLYVADNIPVGGLEACVKNIQPLPYPKLCQLSKTASPSIGLPRPCEEIRRTLADYEKIYQNGPSDFMVHPDFVARAMKRVPEQRESWTCGANSGARFAAMMGNTIVHYHDYMNGMPYYGGGLGIPRIGGNPEGLRNHLRNASELHGTDINQICNVRFHPIWEGLTSALSQGRPALVLLMNSSDSMHWVNVIGRIHENWWILNTNGFIYEIPGGDDALKHWMNMGNCLAQKFNFVERFNCVVANGRHTRRDT